MQEWDAAEMWRREWGGGRRKKRREREFVKWQTVR
jgi:hypothetical protein